MLEVLTFRDRSLLSAIAHDLCFDAAPMVRVEGAQVTVRCRVDGLRVRGKVTGGAVAQLAQRDREQIEATLRREVLHAERNAEIVFEGELSAQGVHGSLQLNGRALPLELPILASAGRVRGEVELVPSRWGVAPYSAMFGALKVQDRVVVRFDLPLA
ncbi:hypothetical protein LBMAG42_42790 [Deltaproteobacteria bacterium]|nr:hypothetical protein LBMAG42_42790 [Deltaproteobacteria bacterium]